VAQNISSIFILERNLVHINDLSNLFRISVTKEQFVLARYLQIVQQAEKEI